MNRRVFAATFLGLTLALWLVVLQSLSLFAVNAGNICLAYHEVNYGLEGQQCENFWTRWALRWQADNDAALALSVWSRILNDGDHDLAGQVQSPEYRWLLSYRLLALAQEQRKEGYVMDALANSQLAVDISPDLAEAQWRLAESLISTGKWQESVAHYEALLKLRPSDVWAYIRLGQEAELRNDYQVALNWFRQAAQVAGDSEYPYIYLSNVSFYLRNYLDAELYARQAITKNATHPQAHIVLAQVLSAQYAAQNAAEEYLIAAKLFVALGQSPEACNAYSQALSIARVKGSIRTIELESACP